MDVEYRADRHIPLEEAVRISGLNREELGSRLTSLGASAYGSDGTRFIDRLDLGRAVYNGGNGQQKGIKFERYFTDGITHPFEKILYEEREAKIVTPEGTVIFSQDVIVPKSWSQLATNVVASKYFHKPHKEEWKSKIDRGAEYDARQLVTRVSKFFADWGEKLGYFNSKEDKEAFEEELMDMQINQKFAFNSPVYFNAGLFEQYGIPGSPGINYVKDHKTGEVSKVEEGCYVRPQCHACFIIGPDDNLESIVKHCITEAAIFASGSGVGQGIDVLRGSGEPLSSGGQSSGAMSFFRLFDVVASLIKSGGKTRRAARMTTMRQNHPDILDFIFSKVREDKKALTLMEAGYSAGMEGEAYLTVAYQNTNISVRLDDYFFEQLKKGGNIDLVEIKSGKIKKSIPADFMLKAMGFGSWRVGDPGVQYESKIQEMNTCPNSGIINSTNPCSEYVFLDKTSCNLGSLNLLKFADEKGNFDVKSFRKAARTAQIALDIANDAASYPSPEIAKISPEFRTTGLGYAHLGALLMRKGLAYDSEEARAFTGAVTSIMHGEANRTSIELSEALGPFVHYELNKEPMQGVMEKHRKSLDDIKWDLIKDDGLKKEAYELWSEVLEHGWKYGFRNAQTTVIAPTGTIALMMDCDTTGIEPAIGLMSTKTLAGGGTLELVVSEVPNALRNLGYGESQINDIVEFIREKRTIEGSPHVSPDHYNVFDTAFAAGPNGRAVSFDGHLRMLGAAQPFISGAISKTCNVPERASVKEIYDGFILGHKLGLKALAVFRDSSKPNSVLKINGREINTYRKLKRGEREELPAEADAYKTRVNIGGTTFHIIIPEFPDGRAGEIFISAYKSGSTMKALVENIGLEFSRAIQFGIPLEEIVRKNIGIEFEPRGITDHPHIKFASSITDFVARLLGLEYLGNTDLAQVPVDKNKLRGIKNGAIETYELQKLDLWDFETVINHPRFGGFTNGNPNSKENVKEVNRGQKISSLGKACGICGHLLVQTSPNCYRCINCGESAGLGCGA